MSQSNPKFTIGIPTLNRGFCLAKAVDSALSQTYENLEVVVSDNASIDNTSDVLNSYHDSRLRVIRQIKTLDPVSNINAVLAEARGDLFMVLSDDDWIEPVFAAKIIEFFEKNSDLSAVYTQAVVHLEDWTQRVTPPGPELEEGTNFLLSALSQKREILFCATVVRTDLLRELGGYRLENFCDTLVWVYMSLRGRIGCVREALAHYTSNTNCGSMKLNPYNLIHQHNYITEIACKGLIEKGVPEWRVLQMRRDQKKNIVKLISTFFMLNAMAGIAKINIWRSFLKCGWTLLRHPLIAAPRLGLALFFPKVMVLWIKRMYVRTTLWERTVDLRKP